MEASGAGHCSQKEEVLFSCRTTRSKTVSLCAWGGKVQYRYGVVGAAEMVYPQTGRADAFRFRQLEEVRHGEGMVSFNSKDHRYQLEESSGLIVPPGQEDESYGFIGVKVATDGRNIASLPCIGDTTRDWKKIQGMLQPGP